jgi:hypothetical protein
LKTFPFSAFHWGTPQGQAVMQDLQPMQSESSTNTIPSFSLFCIAPVGHADTHHGFSQWKHGMKMKFIRGTPPTTFGPTGMILQKRGPTGTSFSVLQWTSHA